MQKITEIDRTETLRYLGYRGTEIPLALQKTIDHCLQNALATLEPKYLYRRFSLESTREGLRLQGTDLTLYGNDIAHHLENCHEAYLLCVTLGLRIEKLIRQSLLTFPEEAVIYDACATAAVEQVADFAENEISDECSHMAETITWRFSPGYGDFPLETQRPFLTILDAHRKIGLTVSESLLLTPGKSVTAVIGVTNRPSDVPKNKCEICPNRETCAFRKRGEQC